MRMQLNDPVFPDASDIAPMAHGDIAVISPKHHLRSLGDDMSVAVDPGIDGSFCTAVANGLDLLNGVRHLHQPQTAGEQLGLKIRP